MFSEADDADHWFDPADIETELPDGSPSCPAQCKRFTHKGDAGGEARDPPRPDVEGQMFFDDLNVPVERVPVRTELYA